MALADTYALRAPLPKKKIKKDRWNKIFDADDDEADNWKAM
jgi:hypothetical protein